MTAKGAHYTTWTDADVVLLKDLRNADESWEEIARRLGRPEVAVRRKYQRLLAASGQQRVRPATWTSDEVATLLDIHATGGTLRDAVAALPARTARQVSQKSYALSLRWPARTPKRPAALDRPRKRPVWSDEDVATLREMAAAGHTAAQIAASIGRSRGSVANQAGRLGVSLTRASRRAIQRAVRSGREEALQAALAEASKRPSMQLGVDGWVRFFGTDRGFFAMADILRDMHAMGRHLERTVTGERDGRLGRIAAEPDNQPGTLKELFDGCKRQYPPDVEERTLRRLSQSAMTELSQRRKRARETQQAA